MIEIKEITFQDYLNNSGTRGTETIYKNKTMSIKQYIFKKEKDGRYLITEQQIPKKIIIFY